MPQIKQIGNELNLVGDDDLIPVQRANGFTGRAKKSVLLAGLSTSNGVNDNLNTIISRSPSWRLDSAGNQFTPAFPCWTSMGINQSETTTGILKIGYLTLKNNLHFLVAGGGATNGNLKVLRFFDASNDQLLLTRTLSQITGQNNDRPVYAIINTSSIANKRVYLQFEDNDSNSSWAWWAFVINSFFIE